MLDAIDRRIIELTQAGLPLCSNPYDKLAQQLNLESEIVMQRFDAMLTNGIIRRIGAVPNHYKLGYRFNGMTVWDVDDAHIDRLGDQIGQLSFVSHCYHRPRHLPEWPYNLFAMVHCKTEEGVQAQIAQIQQILGNFQRQHDVLYSTRILKKTGLRIGAS